MTARSIREVRAFTVRGGGADYHDQGEAGHWIDEHISSPMAKYPEYRDSCRSFGLDVLGTLVVEVEADDGTVGFGVTTAGKPGAFLVERHLARFLEGRPAGEIERIWDQLYSASLFYGRKGLALNVISAIDLALWDLLGKLRGEPVYARLGGPVRDELVCYATGPRPDLAREMGFLGSKMPVQHCPAEGEWGLARTIEKFHGNEERGRPGFLADGRLLDVAGPRQRRSSRAGATGGGSSVDRGTAAAGRLQGLRGTAQTTSPRCTGDRGRARGDRVGIPVVDGDRMLRHHPAGCRVVRRNDRAGEDLRAG